MPKPNSQKGYFEISRTVHQVGLHIGYCCGWRRHTEHLLLIHPWCRGLFWSDMGPVECRVDWPHGLEVPNGEFILTETPYEPWMDVRFEDLVAQHDELAKYSHGVSKGKYRRQF